jgi:hypothetical protein
MYDYQIVLSTLNACIVLFLSVFFPLLLSLSLSLSHCNRFPSCSPQICRTHGSIRHSVMSATAQLACFSPSVACLPATLAVRQYYELDPVQLYGTDERDGRCCFALWDVEPMYTSLLPLSCTRTLETNPVIHDGDNWKPYLQFGSYSEAVQCVTTISL